MAKQTGVHILNGVLGNLVYYTYRGKPVARRINRRDKDYYKNIHRLR
jgi:hypothetical protein